MFSITASNRSAGRFERECALHPRQPAQRRQGRVLPHDVRREVLDGTVDVPVSEGGEEVLDHPNGGV
jgi:hypothetical protein